MKKTIAIAEFTIFLAIIFSILANRFDIATFIIVALRCGYDYIRGK